MECRSTEFECDLSLGDVVVSELHGVTTGYAVNDVEPLVVAIYEYILSPVITSGSKNDPRETRAYREMRRRRGKPVSKIKHNALRDELIILPGAAMSPAEVVAALRRFIEHVEKDGMCIGKHKDDFLSERIAGKPRFVSELGHSV
jgi:hypothetical protein